jgi:hypothetical protein
MLKLGEEGQGLFSPVRVDVKCGTFAGEHQLEVGGYELERPAGLYIFLQPHELSGIGQSLGNS